MKQQNERPPVATGGLGNPEPSSNIPHGQTQAEALLAGWHGEGDWPGLVTIWAKSGDASGKTCTRFVRSSREAVKETARLLAAPERWNVYFSLCQLGQKPTSGRGSAESVAFIPGVWIEIDVQGPGHASQNLCPSFADAKGLLAQFPEKPSFIVNSGGGLHAYWAFPKPLELPTEQHRARARALVRDFQDYFRRPDVNPKGYSIDKTDDLARVLRVPGTTNFKDPEHLRPVTIELSPLEVA